MFHFFLEEQTQSLVRLYHARRASVISIVLCILTGITLLVLIPSYMSSTVNRSITQNDLERLRKLNAKKDITALERVLIEADTMRARLEHPIAEIDFSKLFSQIREHSRSNIRIDGITISGDITTYNVSITGVALTREALVAFNKRLQDSGLFKSVEFPIGHLAQDTNISFTISAKK